MAPSTIRDVARQAGVSIATVSRVMRDPGIVRPGTRDRVLDAARDLQYTPSHLGRQLAERRHAANGIVFPDLSGPYYAEVVLGYENVAAELRRSVLILSTHGRADADDAVREMAGRCDGLVILGRTVGDEVVQQIADRGSPVVLVARPRVGDIDSVSAVNHDSAVALTRHLVDGGARRISFVGDPDASPDVSQRWQGVREAAGACGAEVVLHRIAAMDETAGVAVADAALAGPAGRDGADRSDLPDAFACANDELALGLLARLRDRGVDVPGQVQVSGWDDVMAARYAGLTTVRQPMRELGATAARLLDDVICGSRTEHRHVLLPTELVVRGTTRAAPPADGSTQPPRKEHP